MPVVFKEVPGFPGYKAGTDGSVWSNRHSGFSCEWRRLTCKPNSDGYPSCRLFTGSGMINSYRYAVHQIVLLTFRGPCPEGMEGCHNDGVRTHNVLGNLRWDTKKANAEDCISHGNRPRGADHGRAKITEEEAIDILVSVRNGATRKSMAIKYGISVMAVYRLVKRQLWKHLTWKD